MSAGKAPAIWFPTIRVGTGADVFVQRLCDGLNAKGIRAEITWLPHRAEYLPWTVAVPRPPAWANVVHLNSWLPRRFWPKVLPAVVTVLHLVHDPAYRPFRSIMQAIYHELMIRRREQHAIRDAAAVTTISDYVRRTVEWFSNRSDVAVIYNWVDCDKFSPGAEHRSRGNGPFRLFMAGSHSRRKGIDLLPDFVSALGAGFEIRYAGGQTGDAAALQGVVELGRISQEQLIREYRECDAVISLSRYEGFGYTAAEGMACGRPFLGFATSALAEVVTENSGTLVAVDDVNALAAATRAVRADRAKAKAMGEAGRRRVLAQFSPANVDAFMVMYKSLLANDGSMQRVPA